MARYMKRNTHPFGRHHVRRYHQLPMRRGFLYLVAIRCPAVVCLQTMRGMDWYSRKVLAWRLSNSMDADFCVDALKEALAKDGPPEFFNSDQGCQFTSGASIDALADPQGKVSTPFGDCMHSPAGHRRQRRVAG